MSFSTVSLALNDSPRISAGTKARVRRIAGEVNYQPNPKINELMSQLRSRPYAKTTACLAAIAFYDIPRPCIGSSAVSTPTPRAR